MRATTRGGHAGRERVMLTRDADEKIDIIVERVVARLVPELEAMVDAALTLLAKRAPPPAWPGNRIFTHAEIDAAMAGGFSCQSFAKLGLPYPPPKGWLKRLRAEADRIGPRTIETRAFARVERESADPPKVPERVIAVSGEDDPPW